MIRLTTEQAQQIEEALEDIVRVFKFETGTPVEALVVIRAARAQEQNPVAWYDKIKGMEVSVDVSTGEDDDYHRIFGRVDGVMLQSCGAQEDTILVIEDSRNFDAPQPVQQEPVAVVKRQVGNSLVVHITGNVSAGDLLYAAPVRTKDLTDGAIWEILETHSSDIVKAARAVIAADREKNK